MATRTRGGSGKRTDWFVEDRFGMFIHWGLYSMPARHEWVKHRECMTDEQYQKYFDRFNPDLYEPREWARMAKAAGMKYFVITTKHHEGFCLWDSKHTGYKATNTPCRRDLLKEMVSAFRAEGLKVGFYYSLLDWHHPDFPVDKLHSQRDDKAFREREKNRDVRKYAEYMRKQVTELLTKFGKIDILWFDFSYPGEDGKGHKEWESEKLLKLIRKLQPDIMIDNRLDIPDSGDFETPEQFQPTEGIKDKEGNPVVWEACQTFSGSWGYHRDEMSWREPAELIATLIDCVSKSGNLLMNVGPTARGEFDYRVKERLAAYAEWMKRHDRSIYGCQQAPAEFKCPSGCKLTFNPVTNRLYLHILSWPYKHITMEGNAFTDHVEYAQFLHDGSEIAIKGLEAWQEANHKLGGKNTLSITLPQMKPNVAIPVVELFLKK
ncbi:MAG TPA: alpha-L-fucosidase [Lentisphaeria bacterium]|nr:MAG: alpha-L-fucosidase [Lentisphaerae bacterium GWF2_50_93]HCE45863.1 alpha-L-fucosidase [Lentisphaeria bacterium]